MSTCRHTFNFNPSLCQRRRLLYLEAGCKCCHLPTLEITGSIAFSANRWYLSYSEGNFDAFCPAGATRCTDGVKFGTEEYRAKFCPHQCNDKGIGPQKLKSLLKFYQISEYKRPSVAYRLRDFHEICCFFLVSRFVGC